MVGSGGPISAGERPNQGQGGARKMKSKMDRLWGGSGARDGGRAAGFGRSGERRRSSGCYAPRGAREGNDEAKTELASATAVEGLSGGVLAGAATCGGAGTVRRRSSDMATQ